MKKKQPLKCIVFASAILFSMLFASTVTASQIKNTIKTTIEEVIAVLNDVKFQNNPEAKKVELRRIINPRFSYKQMSMRSLAKHWNSKSDSEKKEFVNLFSTLLENSYASRLESYSNEKINYGEEILKGRYAMLKTKIIRPDGILNIDYKLIQENGIWKIYDFVIEGVSMIKNYRSQFNRIIKKESYEALKQKLRNKIKGLNDNELKS